MLNDPHSLGTSLAKILTIINVHVVSDIIRQLSIGFVLDSLTKVDWFLTFFPLIVFNHTISE